MVSLLKHAVTHLYLPTSFEIGAARAGVSKRQTLGAANRRLITAVVT